MEIEATTDGRTNRIGCGCLLFPILLVYLVWTPAFEISRVAVSDGAKLLLAPEQALVDRLTEIGQRQHLNISVVAVDAVDPRRLAIVADEAVEAADESQSWIGKWLFPRSGHSLTLFYSASPRLLQLRWGRYVHHRARAAALDRGDGYAALQQLALPDGRPDLVAVGNRIDEALTKHEVGFFASAYHKIVSLVSDDLAPFAAIPHFELWRGAATWIADDIYLWLSNLLGTFYLFVPVALLLMSLPIIGMSFYAKANGTVETTSKGTDVQLHGPLGCLLILGFAAVGLFVFAPMLGFVMLSGSARAEDTQMLQAMGVVGQMAVPSDLPWGWIVVLTLATIGSRLPSHVRAIEADENDPEAYSDLAKLVFVVPCVMFVIPGWLCYLSAWAAVGGVAHGAIMRWSTRPPSPA